MTFKALLTVFLFCLLSIEVNAQFIEDQKLGRIDIRELEDSYITVYGPINKLANNHRLETSLGGRILLVGTRRYSQKANYNVFDGDKPVNMGSMQQVLSFFEKYGYKWFQDQSTSRTVRNFQQGTAFTVSRDRIILTRSNQ